MITKGLIVKCTVCGEESEQSVSTGFDFATSEDLDQRPRPEMEGELEFRVMQCPGCGYCATNLATDAGVTREMVDDPDYRKIIESDTDPVCRKFAAKGYLMERTGYFIGAFDAYRSAAWAADDVEDRVSAKRMRIKAADSGKVFAEKMLPAGRCGYADLLRRIGRFDECIILCDSVLASDVSEDIRKWAAFEKKLCSEGDTERHPRSEAASSVL